jgi:hypothetical protein
MPNPESKKSMKQRTFHLLVFIVCQVVFGQYMLQNYQLFGPVIFLLALTLALAYGYVFVCMWIAWPHKKDARSRNRT